MPQNLPLKPLDIISTPERSEKILGLSKSFQHAIKNRDIWEATDIVTKIRTYTHKSEDRHLLLQNEAITNTIIKMINPKLYKYERLMIECSWILASVASEGGSFIKQLMTADIIQKFLDLMRHPNNEVKQNAVWLLTSIAGESLENRDKLIELGVAMQIELLLHSVSPRRTMISNVASLIAQLVRGKTLDPCLGKRTYPESNKVQWLNEYLGYIINKTNDKKTMITALRALCDLSEFAENADCSLIFEPEICSKILPLLKETDPNAIIVGKDIILEITHGDYGEDHLNAFLDNGLIEALHELLKHPDPNVRESGCHGLGVLFLGAATALTQRVLDFKDGQVVKDMIAMYWTDEPNVALSCVEGLRYIFLGGITADQAYRLVSLTVLKFFCEILQKSNDLYILESGLEGISIILNTFDELPDNGELNKAGIVKLIKLYKADALVKKLSCNKDLEYFASSILDHLSN